MALLAGYRPDGATLRAFLASPAFARALIGPRYGGRKVAAVADIAQRIVAAPPARWRIAVAIPRADELAGTVMRAVAEAFGAETGQWDMPARRFALDLTHAGARRLVEFHFFGLDKADHRRQWQAAPATVQWLADARDLAAEVCDQAVSLAGGWAEGADAGRLIVTSRMPAPDHWIALRFAADAGDWRLFRQPGGRDGGGRENRVFLDRERPGCYARLADRLPPSQVASEVDAEWRDGDGEEFIATDPARIAQAALWAIKGGLPDYAGART